MRGADIKGALSGLYSLEELAAGQTYFHRLHPTAKVMAALVYLVCAASFGRYEVLELLPMFFCSVFVMRKAGITCRLIFVRAAAALPFCVFAGVSNLIFDHTTVRLLGFSLSGGMVSMIALIFRTMLCVSAPLLLAALTPFGELTGSLRRLHAPALVVSLLEMVYRYIGVLAEEAFSMLTALRLRGNGARWPSLREFGPFVGQLLLRSADRAERVRRAMLCRLSSPKGFGRTQRPWRADDTVFLLSACGIVLACRLLPTLPGGVFAW